jgi:hypothetical protein
VSRFALALLVPYLVGGCMAHQMPRRVTDYAQAGRASGGATAVHFFVAYRGGKLAPGVQVTSRVVGHCDNTSEVEGRPFVWRCDWESPPWHVLGDPCFSATATSKSAVCPAKPWSKSVVLVRIHDHLHGWKPTHPEILRTWPWGVRTTTGKRCIAIRTGTSTLNGMRVNHACGGGGVLVGPVNRRTRPWSIFYARSPGTNGGHAKLRRVGITDAWW